MFPTDPWLHERLNQSMLRERLARAEQRRLIASLDGRAPLRRTLRRAVGVAMIRLGTRVAGGAHPDAAPERRRALA